jgi:uncharacterized membrane protein
MYDCASTKRPASTAGQDFMKTFSEITHEIHESERQLLAKLRHSRRERRGASHEAPADRPLSLGQRVADMVAATMGSWTFIIVQSLILLVWIILNITAYVKQWDPYPFILLNLALSFQAAYAAPFIMMSQNRQQEIDRLAAKGDYQVNIKAELEIELLHDKIDALRQTEVLHLTEVVHQLADMLQKAESRNQAAGHPAE